MVQRPSAKPTIITVPLTAIDDNHNRDIKNYPWIESKIESLMKSIRDVGLWEGIIARPVNKRYELAFGHHRIEAARRLALINVPLIVRQLDEEQMIKFMARENGDDYRTYFSVLLNTWEATERYARLLFLRDSGISLPAETNVPVIRVAETAGWLKADGQPTNLCYQCVAALRLIQLKVLDRNDLIGLSPNQAHNLIRSADKLADDPVHTSDAEKFLNAMKSALNGLRYGDYTTQAAEAAFNTVMHRSKTERLDDQAELDRDAEVGPSRNKGKRKGPLSFSDKLKRLNDKLRPLLAQDMLGRLLSDISGGVSRITWEQDVKALNECIMHLTAIIGRCETWNQQLTRNDNQPAVKVKDVKEPKKKRGKKQVPLEVVENEEIVVS